MANLSQVGICRLLEENGFAAAFPLHDGQFDLPKVVVLLPESYKCWPNILSNRFLIPGRVDCSGTKPPTSTPPVLGTLGLLVQVPASRSHPRVLRRKDRDLLRLAGLLYRVAPTCSSCWLRRLSLRSLLFEKNLFALHCKLFIAGLKLFYVILSRNGHFGRERDSSGGVPRTSQKVRKQPTLLFNFLAVVCYKVGL